MVKRKKKSTLTEIKRLKSQKSQPPKNKNFSLLEAKIKQFRGGIEDFILAMDSLIEAYETALDSCSVLQEQLATKKVINREDCQLMFPKFNSVLQDFVRDYSLEERQILVTTLFMPKIVTLGELYKLSLTTDEALTLTDDQLESCFFFWFGYQLFKDYLLCYQDLANTLWHEIDNFFFNQTAF